MDWDLLVRTNSVTLKVCNQQETHCIKSMLMVELEMHKALQWPQVVINRP